MSTYAEKLRSPQWQRRRLEIMELANFECESCGDNTKFLNVHHKIYRKNSDPWDYPDEELQCLCQDCHQEEHKLRELLNQQLAKGGPSLLWQLIGYCKIANALEFGEKIVVNNYEEACGVAAAYAPSNPDEIIEKLEGNLFEVRQ